MGREGIWLDQPPVEPVDVARWRGDEEFAVCPEGARDKSLLYSPSPTPYGFLIPGHRYLFKHSAKFYPDQFWTEIIAYRIGCLLGVPVPPALVAWDSDTDTCGALIEWFLDYPGAPPERYVSGGDIMSDMIHGYDRKRGRQHNFEAIERYLSLLARKGKLGPAWLPWWCDALLFDALIGNTDRHRDNRGLLEIHLGSTLDALYQAADRLQFYNVPRAELPDIEPWLEPLPRDKRLHRLNKYKTFGD